MDLPLFSGNFAFKIGSKVRSRRIEDNLTEEAVARALGCDVDHLRAAEAGQINFTPENIVDLCPVLRVMPSWFFEGIEEAG
ncbi:MAG: XRE family transcriptional regulator [Oxalobacteraceae bacterium]|nr:MAG: XRE family transcriptional regulator [Oxalobacteraceae bacterium]